MEYIELLAHALIGYLARTVKNPRSHKAQSLRKIVQEVNEYTTEFLELTDPDTEPVKQ